MTDREKKLLLLVGVVILAGLSFNYFSGGAKNVGVIGNALNEKEAERLLSSSGVIIARNRAATAALAKLEARFYPEISIDRAQLDLLQEVESIASRSGLAVDKKSIARLPDRLIEVTLEGRTGSAALFLFMERLGETPIALKIKNLRIHSLPEERQLEYEIGIISLLR
ncbi:MAG TPA: hypothetical protein VF531_02425 [Bacillota bacterium]